MDFDDYKKIDAVNWSTLKALDTSPLYYQYRLQAPREDTAALRLGRAIHCLVLEPELYESRYLVRPADLDGRTREGKAWAAAYVDDPRERLTADEDVRAHGAAAAVEANYEASSRLIGTRREVSIQWTDAATGIACKGRLDATGRHCIIDLKTTRDITRVGRDAATLMYHGQLAYYVDGACSAGEITPRTDESPMVYIIAVESGPPHDVAVFLLPEYVISSGRAVYRELLSILALCRESGHYPGRYPGVTPLDLPRYARGMEEYDD